MGILSGSGDGFGNSVGAWYACVRFFLDIYAKIWPFGHTYILIFSCWIHKSLNSSKTANVRLGLYKESGPLKYEIR